MIIPFCGMLGSSLLALQHGSVGLLTVVRGTLPLVSLLLERLVQQTRTGASKVTFHNVASLTCIAAGAILYVAKDLSATWSGIFWCGVNLFCSAGGRIFERALLVDASMDLSFAAMNLLNNSLGIMPALLCWFANGEYEFAEKFAEELAQRSPHMLGPLLLSGVVGLALGWWSIKVQKEVNATTFTVIQLGGRFATMIGAATVLGEQLSLVMWFGCMLTFIGAAWFSMGTQQGELCKSSHLRQMLLLLVFVGSIIMTSHMNWQQWGLRLTLLPTLNINHH